MRKWGPGYVLVAPATVLIILMMVYPLIQTLIFSVSEVRLPDLRTRFVGFENFVATLTDPDFVHLIQRTVFWVVGTVALQFVLGFGAALVLNAKVRGTVWMRILVVLPWTIPSVVAANLWRWILQSDVGIVNQMLREFGLSGLALNWLGDTHLTMASVVVAYCWAGYPFIMLLMLAGMQGIPEEIYEAARVDGANWWQLFRFITIPSIRGVLAVALILETVGAINSFDTIMVMTGGGPANATLVFGIDIYRTGFSNFNFGGASALSVLLFAAALIVFLLYAASSRAGRPQTKQGER